jgi:hypothetical protein
MPNPKDCIYIGLKAPKANLLSTMQFFGMINHVVNNAKTDKPTPSYIFLEKITLN